MPWRSGGAAAAQAPAHVGLDHTVVDERCQGVHEEHREHGAFGVSVVVCADDDGHSAHEEAVDVFPDIGAARGHRIGSHEDGSEGESAEAELVGYAEVGGGIGGSGECIGDERHHGTP